jgi:hypothetical protein
MLEQYHAYLLIRMEQMTEQDRREADSRAAQAAYGIAQLARDLSRWTRALVRLPGRNARAVHRLRRA